MKRKVCLFCTVLLLVSLFSAFATVNAAVAMGGYVWSAPSDYHTGTVSVKSSATGSVTVDFRNVGSSDDAAGLTAEIREDWSRHQALNFKVTNTSNANLSLGVGISTGSDWVWHESESIGIPAGRSRDVSLKLKEPLWKTQASNWANTAKIDDIDKVMKVDFKIMSFDNSKPSGSLTISDWKLGDPSQGSGGNHNPNPPSRPATGQFQIVGSNLFDANGNNFIMKGVNHAHTWFKNDYQVAIPAIAKSGANAVRIVLSNGTKDNWAKDSAQSVKTLIELCEKNNLIPILEVHDALGVESVPALMKAVDYWIEIKDVLIGKEDKVIINITNEWFGTWDGAGWAEGYKQAIPALRKAGFKHTLMVDAAGWGQYPASIHDYGVDVFNSDPLKNTMFSIHMYEYAGGNAAQIKNNIDKVIDQGLALCIGEFGFQHTSGGQTRDVDEAYILSYTREVGVGWLAWSWKGNGSPVEYLDLSKDWAGTNLSEWGNTIVNGPNGLKASAVICTVFTGQGPNNPVVKYGDLNEDGTIDSTDYMLIRRYILEVIKTLPNMDAADLNGDGKVDSTDAVLLRRFILEVITKFPR